MATRPIDEKIVAMKMDNSDFVQKAAETTKSMGLLTKFLNKIPGINLGKTADDFKNINKSMNGIDSAKFANSIDTIAGKFSAMGVIGTTALVNITNRAVDAGAAMLKNLTVEPVMDGFREYETKIGSIQTILANTARFGTNVDDVTKSLDTLNDYADKTIYNFGQMTKNIGLFTNAGLKLEESTSMIKGFANAAAASGAGAEEMSRAAFQLSQGLASGFIVTQDWLSLTNAGMGNDNMRRDLIALGHAMGTLKTSTEGTLKNWKESLTDDKWLTKEVFSKYLQAMAGELDVAKLKTLGLTQAQAEQLALNAKMGEEAATKVRTFTQMVGTITESIGSGWSETWELIFGGFTDATQLWSGFTELISEPFNSLTKSRNAMIKSLKDNGVIEDAFVAIGTAIYIVGQAISAMAGGFDKAFAPDKVGLITAIVNGFKNFVAAITPSQESLVKIGTIFEAMGLATRVVIKGLSALGSALLNLVPPGIGIAILDILTKFAQMSISFNQGILNSKSLKDAFKVLGDTFSWIGSGAEYIGSKLAQLTSPISKVLKTLSGGNSSPTTSAFSKDGDTAVGLTFIGTAAKAVVDYIKDLRSSLDPVFNAFKSFFGAIGAGFNWVKDKLSGIGGAIKDSMPSGTTLLAGGFLAAMVTVTGVVMKTLHDITKIFSEWGNVVKGFADTLDSISGALDAFSLNLKANALLTASIAIGALAVSILILSKVDGNKIATSLYAMIGSLSAVIGSMAIMNKYDITGGARVSASIIAMAIALSIMGSAMKKFGDLKPEELTKGLISLVVAMGSIAGSFALMGKFTKDTSVLATAGQIVTMGAAVLMIAMAVKTMGTIDIADLGKGIGSMVVILGAISGAFLLMSRFGGEKTTATAAQFLAIAASMLVLAGAIKILSMMDLASLAKGVGSIAVILAAVAGFDALTSGKSLAISAVGLLTIAAAIDALVIPIVALGLLPIDKLTSGLLGMSVALLAIVVAANGMSASIAGAASIVVMAVALNLIVIPLGILAAMGWGPMLTGIAGLGLTLAVLSGVALLLSAAVPVLLGFSIAIGVFGVAMLAAGAGMALFSTGLLTMAGLTSAAIVTIITTIGALATGIASLIPGIATLVGTIFLKVLSIIRDKAPSIIAAIGETIVAVLNVVSSYIPKVIGALVGVITSLIVGLIDAIAASAKSIISAVVNLVISVIEGVTDAIDKNSDRIVNAVMAIVGLILKIVVEAGSSVIAALFSWVPGVTKAMSKVGSSAESAIADALDAAKIGGEKGLEFSKGIVSQKIAAKKSGEELSASAAEGIKQSDSKKSGFQYVTGFISGLLGRKKDVEDASKQLAGAADNATRERLEIHSPSQVAISHGWNFGKGIAIGMDSTKSLIENSSKDAADSATSGFGGLSSITDKVRNMLFIKDKDVADNKKNAAAVVETYDDMADAKKKKTKAEGDGLSDEFKKFKQGLDDRKYYNQLTLQEELENWQYAQKVYKEGTEDRKQADKEVYRVQNEIIKDNFKRFKEGLDDRKYYNNLSLEDELANWEYAKNVYAEGTEERKQVDKEYYRVQQELIKDGFNFSKKWIDERKDYNELSLKDELDAWKRVQERYLAGTEERMSADKEVYRLKNEINQKLTSLNDEYVKNVKDTNKALIDEEKRLNDEYDNSYKDRVKSLTNFVGLFDKVKEQDPENAVTGTGLVENLRGQVNAFATWSDDIKRLSQKGIDEGLLKELEDMGPSAANEIKALNELTAGQLNEYVALWKTKNELAKTQATSELESLRKETNDKIEQIRKDSAAQLDTYKADWLKKVGEIRKGTTENFIGLDDDMNKIGSNAVKGLMEGMTDQQSPLYAKAKELAKGMEAAIKEALDIHSPSRVMMGLGDFAGQGLAEGLTNSAKMVIERSKKLALTAVDSVNKFISTFQQPTFDNEITLKAVLDDSDINKKLSSLSDSKVPYYLGTTNSLVDSVKAGIRQNGNKTQSSDDSKSTSKDSESGSGSKVPLVIQSILNGRIIAEETVDDISQLMGYRTNLDYVMKGV